MMRAALRGVARGPRRRGLASRTAVVLTADVDGVGEAGERLDVRRGFARNFLLPARLAVPRTPAAEAQYPAPTAVDKSSRRLHNRVRARLAKHPLQLVRKVVGRDGGRDVLHGPVTRANIVAKLAARAHVSLADADVLLDEPIAALGTHTVPVRVGDAVVDLTVVVSPMP